MKRILVSLALAGMLAAMLSGCGTPTPNQLTVYKYDRADHCGQPTCPNIPKQRVLESFQSSDGEVINQLYTHIFTMKDCGQLPGGGNLLVQTWSQYLFQQDGTFIKEIQYFGTYIFYANPDGSVHCKLGDTTFAALAKQIFKTDFVP